MAISLKAARINAGLTLVEVASAVGLTKNTVANYENYNSKPDIITAQAMAKLYGMSVDDIRWKEE